MQGCAGVCRHQEGARQSPGKCRKQGRRSFAERRKKPSHRTMEFSILEPEGAPGLAWWRACGAEGGRAQQEASARCFSPDPALPLGNGANRSSRELSRAAGELLFVRARHLAGTQHISMPLPSTLEFSGSCEVRSWSLYVICHPRTHPPTHSSPRLFHGQVAAGLRPPATATSP